MENNSIYIVHLADYDRDDIFGYFISYEEAEKCRKYFEETSDYRFVSIEELGRDTTDYASKLTAIEEDKLKQAKELEEATRQSELELLAELKAKYEGV